MRLFCAVVAILLSVTFLVQADTNLSGKWEFVLDTEGGVRNAPVDLKVDGTTVTGKFGEADIKGTFADGKLELAFPFYSDEAGFNATMKISGKMDNADIAGNWEFGQYTGTFRAKRKE